ncbi:hypothetical protein [Polaromonas sp.]|uniref:hypothetical protein n=1 Tax=Polaromonas sp. TaxID=1869339 RepID=UPI003BAA389E
MTERMRCITRVMPHIPNLEYCLLGRSCGVSLATIVNLFEQSFFSVALCYIGLLTDISGAVLDHSGLAMANMRMEPDGFAGLFSVTR